MDDPTAKAMIAKMEHVRFNSGYTATKRGTLFTFFVPEFDPDAALNFWSGERTLGLAYHRPLLFETLLSIDPSFFEHTDGVACVAPEGIWLNSEDGGSMDFHAHLIPWSSVVWLVSHAAT